MRIRHVLKLSAVALLLLPPSIFAQIPPTRGQSLPDLVPADLRLDKDCRIVVTVRNNGPANVPDAGYSHSLPGISRVQIYKGNAPWGWVSLGSLDPSQLSQPAGGTVSYMLPPPTPALTPGTWLVKVDVDKYNSIAENNELNNSLTENLSCQPELPLPDLVPTNISLQPTGPGVNSPCQIVITLKNNGPGSVVEENYCWTCSTQAAVGMHNGAAGWGGLSLRGADPSKLLQPPGGTLTYPWFAGSTNLFVAPGEHVLRVDVDVHHNVGESNEANNSLTQTLTCGIMAPPTTKQP